MTEKYNTFKRFANSCIKASKLSLSTIFVHEYKSTLELFSKIAWPLSLSFLIVFFEPQVRSLFDAVTNRVREATTFKYGRFEVTVEEIFKSKDSETLRLFDVLSKKDIELFLGLSLSPLETESFDFTEEEIESYKSLEKNGLVSFVAADSGSTEEIDFENVEYIDPTSKGESFYQDLEDIIFDYLEDISQEVESSEKMDVQEPEKE